MNKTLLLKSVVKRRLVPAITVLAATVGFSFVYLRIADPEYIASARLIVDERSVSLSELGQELTTSRAEPPGDANPLATESELIKSQAVIEKAISLLAKRNLPTDNLRHKEIAKRLRVKIIPATNILEISYRTSQPEQAANLLNAILQAMVVQSTEAIRSEASTVRAFLETKVAKLRSQLAEAENAESVYRQQSGLVSSEKQAEQLIERLSSLEETENQLTAQLQGAIARDHQLQQITGVHDLSQAYAAVRAGQNAELRELRERLLVLETQIINSQSRLGDQHPDFLALLEQRDATRALYTEQVTLQATNKAGIVPEHIAADELSQELLSQLITAEFERSALERSLSAVQSERSRLQERLSELPLQQKRLATLSRKREEVADSLALLQNKLEEARIAEVQLVSNIRIIDQANVPSDADWPQPKAVLVLATVAGAVLAVGIIVLLEVLDNSIHSTTEVEAITQLPNLGILPKLPAATLNLHQPETFLDAPELVESYRMLLQTLEFQSHNRVRIIVVSSTVADEGKSTVASHLAAVAALLSRRTLLIDFDLRCPSQADLFHQSTSPGITMLLEGKSTLLETAQATQVDNLWLLPHGNLSKRPSVLLEQVVQAGLLAEATQHFDYVVIDTPPVSSCADAMTISRRSDGIFLVIRPDFTPRSVLQQATVELKKSGIPLLGTVMNGGVV